LECATFWSLETCSGLIPLEVKYRSKTASSAILAFADHGSQGLVQKDGFSATPFLTTDFNVCALLIIVPYLFIISF
jgi:hypothetical protein